MTRILIYSHDTFGLGNIRRMLAIAHHLVDSNPDTCVLIASGSPMLHAFRLAPRIDYLKLPCLKRTVDGDYKVKTLGLGYDRTLKLRANLLRTTIEDFAPDLILVDKKPYGVGNELRPAMQALAGRDPDDRPKLVLLLRDILDSPPATVAIWEKNGYHDAIQSLYDQVLVVGSADIFDLPTAYRFPTASADKVRFCGFLRRERGLRSNPDIRDQLRVGLAQQLVLVTAGGGEDGGKLLSCYLDGLQGSRDKSEFHTLLVCGPELPEAQLAQLTNQAARCPNVTLLPFSDDLMSYMGAADLIVSMAGYNTVCEILTLKKRAIVVPRVEPVQEQWIRAERLAQRDLLHSVHPDELTPDRLLVAVKHELDCCNVLTSGLYQIDMDGLERIGQCTGELLGQKQTGGWQRQQYSVRRPFTVDPTEARRLAQER